MQEKNLKKKILILAAFMAGCGLLGGISGFAFGAAENKGLTADIIKAVKNGGLIPSVVIFAAVNILLCVISLAKYISAGKKFRLVSKDDDDGYIDVEHSLNMPSLFSGVLTIFNIVMLPVIIYFIEYSSLQEKSRNIFIIIIIAVYIAFILFSFILSRFIVELVKKINPEMKGDLLDLNFQKSWENSSDEAQKFIMYKAAYKSFKTVKYACLALWVLCLISQLVFKTGILPEICVGVIFTASTISYSREIMKMEKS